MVFSRDMVMAARRAVLLLVLLMVPVEAIISRYAALVEAALDAGQPDEARRLLMLLKSLGGEVP